MKNKKLWYILIIVFILLFIIRSIVLNFQRATPVQVITPVIGELISKVRASGTITSRRVFKITSPTSGQVQDIPSNLTTGTKVAKGQIIAVIKPTEEDIANAEEELKTADINLKLAQQKYDLTKKLYDMKAIAQQELIREEINLMREDSAVQKLRSRLQGKQIVVPFDSVIVKMNIKTGEIVGAGAEMFTIADMTNLIAVLNVNESDISKIYQSQKVDIIGTDITSQLRGKVETISMVAQETSTEQERREPPRYLVQVGISVPEKNELRLGGNIWGEIALERKENVLNVPLEAILYDSGSAIPQPYVYLNRTGVAKKVFIETGINDGKNVEIMNGVNTDDQVITVGNVNLRDGRRVRLITKSEMEEEVIMR